MRLGSGPQWIPTGGGQGPVSILQMGTNEAQGGEERVPWGPWELASGLVVLCTALGEMGLHPPSHAEDSGLSPACHSC